MALQPTRQEYAGTFRPDASKHLGTFLGLVQEGHVLIEDEYGAELLGAMHCAYEGRAGFVAGTVAKHWLSSAQSRTLRFSIERSNREVGSKIWPMFEHVDQVNRRARTSRRASVAVAAG